jgi:XRE family transcriptional regulator, regulator of sulfur utilization
MSAYPRGWYEEGADALYTAWCYVPLFCNSVNNTGSCDVQRKIEKDEIRQAFALTVRALRTRQGLAQETLALNAGVNRGYMGQLERAICTPTLETIFRLLPELGVNFGEFAAEFEMQRKRLRRNARPL